MRPLRRKLVLVGDEAVGKTAILSIHTRGEFPDNHVPTVFENYMQELWVSGAPFRLSLVDTAGHPQMSTVRSLSYADTHVVILCFAVDQPKSLMHAVERWPRELAAFCPGVALILLATKCDLREDPMVEQRLAQQGEHPVTFEEGLEAAARIGAHRYLECSAMHDIGIGELFEHAARIALDEKPRGARTTQLRRRRTHRLSVKSWFSAPELVF
ncbi:P-loop containing nucleoside triphosphate hydrolase protein [Thamnocephalis sphaerospora]|uniref:P-loop containing nucleoside triphosphate hydrolase protein n=1 Tax=Thamnocephalis sphaerospora TaxID=78915 RepID=A0A4P9XMF8_9FUNG|nr:P-loop containing nucleoside triphosphate hydrolase protein [Thamnocephalis sphaerospora]|eukprot:RKP07094.1 P-loop containing nucleoside triphosphate hydrolase protein [Thamnocephalis sphaerospora]